MKANFDETIGKINIIPQDIGRVILNLLTNAFYAVNEKLTAHNSQPTINRLFQSVQVKANGGEIKVETNAGEGASFLIFLSIV